MWVLGEVSKEELVLQRGGGQHGSASAAALAQPQRPSADAVSALGGAGWGGAAHGLPDLACRYAKMANLPPAISQAP